jgi:hypothetical protein
MEAHVVIERDYQQLVARAEKVVAGVTDPELKRVAFEKVLDDLLVGAVGSGASGKEPTGKVQKKSAKKVHSKKTQTSAKKGPQSHIKEMVDEKFFDKPKTIAQVKAELENRGHHIPLTSLSGPLQKLTQQKVLRRQRSKTAGNKQTYVYSVW